VSPWWMMQKLHSPELRVVLLVSGAVKLEECLVLLC